MKKEITYQDKSYTLTSTPGYCFLCKYEKPCKNFHCSGGMCGITEMCVGHTGKTDYCPFKEN